MYALALFICPFFDPKLTQRMQSDFQFSAGEETGASAVNEAYLKGLYAGMHFSSVSSCWSTTPFFGGGVAAFHSFSQSPTPVEKVGLVPYENLYGFSPETETPPDMSFRKQDDRNFTGVFDLQKFSRNVYTGEIEDGEIYPTVQLSSLPLLESIEQHRLFKSQPQPPVTTMFSPPINLPLTQPSSSAAAAAKSQFKPVKTTRRSSSKRPSPYQISSASAREGDPRRKLSDKTRCLQNLIPGGNKMDIATMLQEAYKYIKFLQAQAIALHSMPLNHHHGSYAAPPLPDDAINVNINGGLEALGKLNRQQLLQLMVNSPMAQTVLYRRGCCIYSVEQLNYLRQLAG